MIWIIPKYKAIFTPTAPRRRNASRDSKPRSPPAISLHRIRVSRIINPDNVFHGMDGDCLLAGSPPRRTEIETQVYLSRSGSGAACQITSTQRAAWASRSMRDARFLSGTLNTIANRHPDRILRVLVAEIADRVNRGDDCWQALSMPQRCCASPANRFWSTRRNARGTLRPGLCGEMADGIERRADYRRHLLIEFIQPVRSSLASERLSDCFASLCFCRS